MHLLPHDHITCRPWSSSLLPCLVCPSTGNVPEFHTDYPVTGGLRDRRPTWLNTERGLFNYRTLPNTVEWNGGIFPNHCWNPSFTWSKVRWFIVQKSMFGREVKCFVIEVSSYINLTASEVEGPYWTRVVLGRLWWQVVYFHLSEQTSVRTSPWD